MKVILKRMVLNEKERTEGDGDSRKGEKLPKDLALCASKLILGD